VAVSLGLDPATNPQVKDAFLKVNDKIKSVYQIGDIKQSARTDLGDKWLLCNGTVIRKPTYPTLVDNLHSTAQWYFSSWASVTSLTRVIGAAHLNGIYFLFGNTSSYPAIAYSETFSKTANWTTVILSTSVSADYYVSNMQYLNGKYIALHSNSGTTPYLWYSDSYSSGFAQVQCGYIISALAYGNGYYVAQQVQNGAIAYSSDLVSWSQTSVGGDNGSYGYGKSVYFDGTRFVVPYVSNGSLIRLYYASNPTSSWSLGASVAAPNNSYTWIIRGFGYVNGYYCVYATMPNTNLHYVFYTPNYNGTFTYVNLGEPGVPANCGGDILYVNNQYIIPVYLSKLVLFCGADLSSLTEISTLLSLSGSIDIKMFFDEESYIISGNTGSLIGASSLLNGDAKTIPTISVSGAYAYIKALD